MFASLGVLSACAEPAPRHATRSLSLSSVQAELRVHPQPEHIDYTFTATTATDWTIELARRVAGRCEEIIDRRVESSTLAVSGTWLGVAPGGSYCARATGSGETLERTIDVPDVTVTASVTPDGLTATFAATTSTPSTGGFFFADGSCASTDPVALRFTSDQFVTLFGPAIDPRQFSIATWFRPRVGGASGSIFDAEAGAVRLSLVAGDVQFEVRTSRGEQRVRTGSPLSPPNWAYIVASYDGATVRLHIDGILRASIPHSGSIVTQAGGGGRIGGVSSDVVSLTAHDRTLTATEIADAVAAGPRVSSPPTNALRAYYTFDEAEGVQTIYDRSGRGATAVRGANQGLEAFDPVRIHPLADSFGAYSDPNRPSVRVAAWTRGPTYCWRAVVSTPLGMFTTRPATFSRVVDTTPPVLTLRQPNVVLSCDASQVTLTPPSVRDDFDPVPRVEARLNTTSSPPITFPYAFSLGPQFVFWSATDMAGNVGWARQDVRVVDRTPPVIRAGSTVIIEATDAGQTYVAVMPERVIDECGSAVTVVATPAAGRFPLGDTLVRFDAADASGNVASATRLYRITDTTPPDVTAALEPIAIAHTGASCIAVDLPQPDVVDNGYPSEQITVTNDAPSCLPLGSYTVRWTLADPAGNSRTVDQSVVVRSGALSVATSLEVGGGPATAGRYYDESVTLIIDVSGGDLPYDVRLIPAPSALTSAGGLFRATYDQPGDYGRIFVEARDDAGQGPRLGSVFVDGFGVDLSPPIVSLGVLQGVLHYGENVRLDRFFATDEPAAPFGLTAVDLGDADTIEIDPFSLTEGTIEAWLRLDDVGDGWVLGGLRVSRGALSFERGGVVVRGGRLMPRVWHHVAATFDGNRQRLYIDGVPAGQSAGTSTVARINSVGPLLDGRLAGVTVWRRPLSELELSRSAGIGPAASGDIVLSYAFDGSADLVTDRSGSGHNGRLIGATRVAVAPPTPGGSSGLVAVEVDAVAVRTGQRLRVAGVDQTPTGRPARGERRIGGLRCTPGAASVCQANGVALDAELLAVFGSQGLIRVEVRARDAAGNQWLTAADIEVLDFVGSIDRGIASVDDLIADPLNGDPQELRDARAALSLARTYATMTPAYIDGAYLIVDNAVETLVDLLDVGIDATEVANLLSRAVTGDVTRRLDATEAEAHERPLVDRGRERAVDARFEASADRDRSAIRSARDAYDAIAVLHDEYRPMRSRLRTVRGRWQQQLGELAAGRTTEGNLRVDSARLIQVQRLMAETRDMLANVLHPQLVAIVSEPRTTQKRSLNAILDVLDKTSSSDPEEAGDLVAITTSSVGDACLDRLAVLRLDDRVFAQCYLRLNDLARLLDSVSEPLIHTYRFRAGVAQALFHMLELTLYVSPTGVPWVSSFEPTPGVRLVLPDAQAAAVPAALPVNQVDFTDDALDRSYRRHAEARAALDDGDIDTAWRIFVVERCLITRVFNRYYSTRRTIPNVADPKEGPLDAVSVDCDSADNGGGNARPVARVGGPYRVDEGGSVRVDASASFDHDGMIVAYDWDLDGDGQYDDASGPDVRVSTVDDGVVEVRLRVTDAAGGFGFATGYIFVDNVAPSVTALTGATIDEGDEWTASVTLSDPGSDTHRATIDFGDGTIATVDIVGFELPIAHVFGDAGTFTVDANVCDDDGGCTRVSTSIVVNDVPPIAGFDWAPRTRQEGGPVTFLDRSIVAGADTLTYRWDFAGQGASTLRNPAFTFGNHGAATVCLIVTDDDGSSDTACHVVTILDAAPRAAFDWTPRRPAQAATVRFVDRSTSAADAIVSRRWSFGAITAAPSFAFARTGAQTICLVVEDADGSTDEHCEVIVVDNAPPIAHAGGPYAVAEGAPLTLTAAGSSDAGGDIVDYAWDLDGDGAIDARGVTVQWTYADEGTVQVNLRVTDSGGASATATALVTITNAAPTAATDGPYRVDEGAPIPLDASRSTDPGSDALAYEWDLDGDGAFDDAVGPRPRVTRFDDVRFVASVRVTDGRGESDIAATTVDVINVAPVIAVLADGAATLGAIFERDGSFADPGNDTWTATVQWGDGSPIEPLVLSDRTFSLAHVFAGAGTFTVEVRIVDDDGGVGVTRLTVVASDTNNVEPVVLDDAFITTEATPLDVAGPGVLANDTDGDGDGLVALLLMPPMFGTLVLGEDGGFSYVPELEFDGVDQFTYQATDGAAFSAAASVRITVTPDDGPPIAVSDSYDAVEDETLSIDSPGVLVNDRDPESDAFTAVVVTPPGRGSLTLEPTGRFVYSPPANFFGEDSFTYLARNARDSPPARVTIDVRPVNDPPVANDDVLSTDEDMPIDLAAQGVLRNDEDVDGDALTAVGLTGPTLGQVVLRPDGSMFYQPFANTSGTDRFGYLASDGSADSDAAVIEIRIEPVNDAPLFVSEPVATGTIGATYAYDAVAQDPELGAVMITLVDGPVGMTVTDGRVRWTPTGAGSYVVTLEALDDRLAASRQTFVVRVLPPLNRPPRFITDPVTSVLLIAPSGNGQPLDMRNWLRADWPSFASSTGPADWQVSDDGTSVHQTKNSFPSAFYGPEVHADYYVQGQLRVDDHRADDDYLGFVYGFQDPEHFYLVDWKGQTQGLALEGVAVKVADADAEITWGRFFATYPGLEFRTLDYGGIGWRNRRTYDVAIEVHATEAFIEVKYNDLIIFKSHVEDSRYLAGRFGFFSFSQRNTSYFNFVREVLPDRRYAYDADAIDPDGDTITYRLITAPSGMTITSTSGELHMFAATRHVGRNRVVIEADDGRGGIARQSFLVTVVDQLPQIVSTPEHVTVFGRDYVYDVQALDPTPNEVLTYALLAGPPGMTMTSSTGRLRWIAGPVGRHQFKVTATDLAGHLATQTASITVIPNTTPVITSTPAQRVLERATFEYRVEFADPDPGEEITVSVARGPVGMVVGSDRRTVTWTPTAPQVGIHDVELIVRDLGGAQARQQFDLIVDNVNDPPHITSVPSQSALQGTLYEYTISVDDPDPGDSHRFVLTGPDGMEVAPATGVVHWTPRIDQLGAWAVSVRAIDRDGLYTIQNWTVSVTDENDPPAFVTQPLLVAFAMAPYAYDAIAADPDPGDVLSYSLDLSPSGMSGSAGRLRWTPSLADVGMHAIRVTATDPLGLSATQMFVLEVRAPNRAPSISSTPPLTAVEGLLWRYDVAATDPNPQDALTYRLDFAPIGMSIDNAGVTTWIPRRTDAGAHAVRVRVSDPAGLFVTQAFTVDASVAPYPPEVVSPPVVAAVALRPYFYRVRAIDPNPGDTLTFTLDIAPAGMTIESTVGTLQWTPSGAGSEPISVRVTDSTGLSVNHDFTIVVSAANTTPVIVSDPITSVLAATNYTYAVRATDPDPGDVLTYALTEQPTGMTIDALGVVRWQPALPDVGVHRVTIAVTDASGATVTQQFELVVVAVNRPPTFTSQPGLTAVQGTLWIYEVDVTDPDPLDTVTLTLTRAPSRMSLSSGVLRWTPRAEDVGLSQVTIRATDEAPASVEQSFTLTIVPLNHAPEIISDPPRRGAPGHPVAYDVVASDPDGDLVELSLVTAPPGMSLDSPSGLLHWIPNSVGTATVTIQAEDPGGLATVQTFAIEIAADITPPLVHVTASPAVTEPSVPVTLTVFAADDIGVATVELAVSGIARTLDPALQAQVTLLAPGLHDVVATVTDIGGNTSVARATIAVRDTSDTAAPTVEIERPLADQIVGSPIAVIGTAADAQFVVATLSHGRGHDGPLTMFATMTSSVVAGQLAAFDPTMLENGLYRLVLEVTDAGGAVVRTVRSIRVRGSMKFGAVTRSVDDASFAAPGGSVVARRVFDDRSAPGEFGPGWRFDVSTARLEHNRAPSEGWAFSDDGGAACDTVQTTASRVTEVRLSNDEFYGFAMDLLDPTATADGCSARVSFESVDGTIDGAALRILSNEFVVLPAGQATLLDDTTMQPYLPRRVELTRPDGTVVEIDSLQGVTRRSDRSGNTLYVTPAGWAHSSGRSFGLRRDAAGRIIELVDPAGQSTRYVYSPAGSLVRVTTPTGAVTEYEYDAQGRLRVEIDPNGGRTRHRYAGGRRTEVVDAEGATTTFEYDLDARTRSVNDAVGGVTLDVFDTIGNRVRRVDAEGGVWQWTYDARSQVTRIEDPLGRVATRTYDQRGRRIAQTDFDRDAATWTLDAFGSVTTSTDAGGVAATHRYDAAGHRVESTVAGARTVFTYDARGLPLTITGPRDGLTRHAYDAFGDRVVTIDALDRRTARTFDAAGRRRTETRTRAPTGQPEAIVTRTRFDAAGRLIARTDARGGTTEFTRDPAGRVVRETAADGAETTFERDRRGEVVRTVFADGAMQIATYDPMGRLATTTDALGALTRIERDRLGREVRRVAADGTSERTEYDAIGRVTLRVDARELPTRHSYLGRIETITTPDNVSSFIERDGAGRIVRRTDGLGRDTMIAHDRFGPTQTTWPDMTTTSLSRDANGRPVGLTDEAGRQVGLTRDLVGQVTAISDRSMTGVGLAHDEIDNLAAVMDGFGQATLIATDAVGGRTRITRPSGAAEQWVYDRAGRPTDYVDPGGARTLYAYDVRGRLIARTAPGSLPVVFGHDLAGRVLTAGAARFVYDVRGAMLRYEPPHRRPVDSVYDASGHRTSVATLSGTTRYQLDWAGRTTRMVDHNGRATTFDRDDIGRVESVGLPNGVTTVLQYDLRDRVLSSVTTDAAGTVVVDRAYTYEMSGRIERVHDRHTSSSFAYSYDGAGRVLFESHTDGNGATTTSTYAYDLAGNRVSKTRSGFGTTTYTYDLDGRLVSESGPSGLTTYTYDARDNVIRRTRPSGATSFAYDGQSRLSEVREGSDITVYRYDAQGRPFERARNGVVQARYTVDAAGLGRILEEVDASGNRIAVYAFDGERILSLDRAGAGTFFAVYDARGDLREWIDGAGGVVATRVFDSFGNLLDESGIAPSSHGFSGLRHHAGVVGLGRPWDPATGRYLTPDRSRLVSRYTKMPFGLEAEAERQSGLRTP